MSDWLLGRMSEVTVRGEFPSMIISWDSLCVANSLLSIACWSSYVHRLQQTILVAHQFAFLAESNKLHV